VFLMS